jgi:DNA-binding transcriptional ArsR family regulator
MVSPTDLAPSLARAVGHPLRVRILAALDDGPRGLELLATQVEADRRSVARHARVLEQAGLVTSTRSTRTTTFALAKLPFFSDEEYGTLPRTAREAAVAATLAHCHTAAAAALQGGGFDREDIHLSRTSLELTERQWRELTAEFADLLERVETTAEEPTDEAAELTRATAVLMLFERSGGGGAHDAGHEDEPFSVEEGLERAWGLSEELDRVLSGTSADWASVVALADQLRVVARSALASEVRGAERAAAPSAEALARG